MHRHFKSCPCIPIFGQCLKSPLFGREASIFPILVRIWGGRVCRRWLEVATTLVAASITPDKFRKLTKLRPLDVLQRIRVARKKVLDATKTLHGTNVDDRFRCDYLRFARQNLGKKSI